MTAVAIQHRDQIISRISAGEYLTTIAASIGLAGKGQAISNALAKDPEYQTAREYGLEAKMAVRESEMEVAAKADVPRARELLGHARWRAERECPDRWGGKAAQVTVNILQVDGQLDGLARDAISQVRALPAK